MMLRQGVKHICQSSTKLLLCYLPDANSSQSVTLAVLSYRSLMLFTILSTSNSSYPGMSKALDTWLKAMLALPASLASCL